MTNLPYLLRDYGVLQFSGPGSRSFLQGQLSNDLGRLQPDQPLLAGLHNPQGRAMALLRLVPAGSDAPGDVLAILPRELLDTVSTLLRRFVLRAKVTISDASADWQVNGMCATDGASRITLSRAEPESPAAEPAGDAVESARQDWSMLQIAAGVPEVYADTAGEFVAQMLNLDCLEAIAWDKGCYTGQEIVARAHYRGQVKRRMRRFVCATVSLPVPGSTWTTSDGVPVRVVRSARTAERHATSPNRASRLVCGQKLLQHQAPKQLRQNAHGQQEVRFA